MTGIVNLPLADKRTPFVEAIAFQGLDFTGAAFLMHFRNQPGDTGTPVISLANATAGTQGLSVAVATSGGVPTSTLTIRIDEATMEALPFASPTSEYLILHYDLHITPSGGTKRVWLRGLFYVDPGVTI